MKPAFRYPSRALILDFASSASGFAVCAGLLGFARPAVPVAWVLAAASALFLVYFGRTVCRQMTHIELEEAGIRASGPLGAVIRWDNLRSLQLDYYSTRADREGGWMQLKLRDAQQAIRIDSELDGFAAVVDRASRAALERGLALDAATLGNLQALRS